MGDRGRGRIATIRAERNGEGIALTPQQARALAGEWYEWFIARHPASDQQKVGGRFATKYRKRFGKPLGMPYGNAATLTTSGAKMTELRKAVRPVLADIGETAQFLAMKRLTLNSEARERFPRLAVR